MNYCRTLLLVLSAAAAVAAAPTSSPSSAPTIAPSASPSISPSLGPTTSPTVSPESPLRTPTPFSTPTTSVPTPLKCTSAPDDKSCAALGLSCEWVSTKVCSTTTNCKVVTYGCQDRAFCEIDLTSFQPKAQCDARAVNCNWAAGSCNRNCPAGVPGRLPTARAMCSSLQLSSTTSPLKSQRYSRAGAGTLERFGEGFAGNADFDGDGIIDLAFGVPDLPPKFSPDRDGTGGVNLSLSRFPNQLFEFKGVHLEGRFGTAIELVDLNGDGRAELVISAPYANTQNFVRSGVVFIVWSHANFSALHRSGAYADMWNADPNLVTKLQGSGSMFSFGKTLARAGDFNGDGFADLVIGADAASLSGRYACGQATVLFGGVRNSGEDDENRPLRQLVISGKRAFTYFGTSVAGNGDVNGDGYADIVVGAPFMNLGVGEAVVIYGRAEAIDVGQLDLAEAHNKDWFTTLSGSSNSQLEHFGTAVSIVGDLNMDGLADVAVGAPYFATNNKQQLGRTYVFWGSRSLVGTTPGFFANGLSAGDRFGLNLVTNGPVDFNGDGFPDLVVGFPQKPQLGYGGGIAVVYGDCQSFPSPLPLGTGASSVVLGIKNSVNIGQSVFACGDLNQDGRTDLCLGAPDANNQKGLLLSLLTC
ncbi:hypothetical protein BASA81_016559 [Batrachochytrium salamandrivorans]|nr:hypothetical protein BASA81_016559 [Batrachochytrium salamandrivorans]